MSDGRRKKIANHMSEKELDEKLARADDGETVRRLSFVKNLYQGDTVQEAADRVGRSEATGDRWADAWNEGGLDGVAPSHGGGRPPKLDDTEQQQLKELLREGQPWESQEIQQLIEDEFGVEYHSDYLSTFLRKLGFTYSPQRPTDSSGSDRGGEAPERDGDDPHNEHEGDYGGGWILDDDACADGGTPVGIRGTQHPPSFDRSG